VPRFEAPVHLSLIAFFRLSPLAVLGTFAVGAAHGVFYNMGSYYAEAVGLSAFQVSIFMTLAVLGAGLFQWPLGRLSDRVDRRWVIALAALVGGLAAALAIPARAFATDSLLGLMFLFGGLALPLYSLLGAFANDRLKPEQMVAASSSIVLCYGIGAFFGPLLVGFAMGRLGPDSFLAYLAGIHIALGLFTLYRMMRRPRRQRP
jgi:MFS family permease